MEPTYNINDVVIVMKKNDYNVGEIISYINKDEIITHRIIQKYYKNNEKIFPVLLMNLYVVYLYQKCI